MLHERGYVNLEGLDLSAGMLREAAKKGVYRALYRLVLGEEIALPRASYDLAFSHGVFVRSHAPATSLLGLARVVKPGGYVIFTLRPEFYEASDFKPTIDRMLADGAWRHLETGPRFDARVRDFPGIELQVWVFETL
jgi:SAM-dependent methyltransferase